MKLLFWAFLTALFALALGLGHQDDGNDGTTSTSSTSTIVYTTITTNGQVATVPYNWIQSFMTTYSDTTSSVAAGSVGIGSMSGSVGQVRTYLQTTITNAAAGAGATGLLAILLLMFL